MRIVVHIGFYHICSPMLISLQELEGMLIAAAADGSTEEVIRLLDGGVNVDATDEVRCSCQLAFI